MASSSPHRAHERILVHWINSLPLASCLLVDTLEELRLGDVLDAIVAWLQDEERHEGLNPRICVVDAVAFAAQRCTAADDDAVFIVNSAQCAARIAAGDTAAIAAVVTVLRRLAMEKKETQLAFAAAQSQEIRLRVGRAIQKRPCREADDARLGEEEASGRSQSQTVDSASQRRKLFVTKSPRTHHPLPSSRENTRSTQRSRKSTTESDSHQRENDPRNRIVKSACRRPAGNNVTSRSSEPVERDILSWMESLGVVCHNIGDQTAVVDDVVLCQLAAAIARRRGSVAERHKLHTIPTPQRPRGVWFPRGVALQPRTKSERRHNLSIAWGLLKECRVVPVSAIDLTPEALADVMEGNAGDRSIWSILAHVQKQTQQPAPTNKATKSSFAFVEDGTCVRRPPYITAEQMDVVKRWMKSVGVDPSEVSSGILEDCLRNGVALCRLLCERSKRSNLPCLVYREPPKTLLEVRANIHAAISTMATLGEPSIPAVYLTKQALDGITIGDKQFIYGVLRHVMQVCIADDACACQSPVAPTVSPPPRPPTEQRTVKNKRAPLLPRQGKPKVTTLFLDVPACQLVEEECRDGELATLVGCRTAPWDAISLMDDEDDIVPTASRRLPAPVAETDDALLDIVPLQRAVRADPSIALHDDPTTRHLLQSDRSETAIKENDRTSRSGSTASECIASPTARRVAQDADEDVGETTTVQEGIAAPTLEHQREEAVNGDEAVRTLPVVATEVVAFSSMQVNHVLSWLKRLGIQLADADAFRDPSGCLSEFTSGVVLCTIVEKLEHMRRMEGVCRHEKIARANALHNIDKAFEVLRRKKMLPLGLLRQKMKVYEGDRTTIVSLLLHMRKAYRHSIPHKAKP